MTRRMTWGAVLALACGAAAAVPITSADDPALQGASVIDFESTAPTPYTSLTVQGVTITASPSGGTLFVVPVGVDGANHALTNYRTTLGIDFRFAEPVGAFGFRTFTLVEPATMTAYDVAGNVIESAVSPAFATSYAGLAAGAPVIARIVFEPNHLVVIDDLSVVVGSVPEPASALLAGLGLAMLAATRRRWSTRPTAHSAGPTCSAISPMPSMRPSMRSPGTTGPTPSGVPV